MRGVAAISVVVYHLILVFYPRIAYGDNSSISVRHSSIENVLYGTPLNSIFSGLFAVSIFFVLSGFVLSIGFFKSGDESVIKKLAAKRYLRLMLPALASVILAYILIKTDLSHFREQAAQIVGGGSAGIQWNFAPHILDAIKQGAWSIFMTGEDSYNRVLWTMHYEFFGSFMIFATLFVFGAMKSRWIIYAFLLLATISTWYFGFVIGVILADLYVNTNVLKNIKKHTYAGPIILILGLFLGGYPALTSTGTMYSFLRLPFFTDIQNTTFYLGIAASLLIVSVLCVDFVKRFFSHKYISILGKYTFSLYLTHILVILTVTTALFVFFNSFMGYGKSVLFATALSLPVIVGVAWVFEKYIDGPSIKLSGSIAKKIDGDELITPIVLKRYYNSMKIKVFKVIRKR